MQEEPTSLQREDRASTSWCASAPFGALPPATGTRRGAPPLQRLIRNTIQCLWGTPSHTHTHTHEGQRYMVATGVLGQRKTCCSYCLHAATLCMWHNCLTAQNNHSPSCRPGRAKKGLTQRGKQKLLIKPDDSHISQHHIYFEKLASVSLPRIRLARSFRANMVSSGK